MLVNRTLLHGGIVVVLVLALAVSNWLAPAAMALTAGNADQLLNWGAPALFHHNPDTLVQLEPWRLLGLQLPAFAGIDPDLEPVDVIEELPPNPPPSIPAAPVAPEGRGVVAIYHSHTSESFVPTSGRARSHDPAQTVVRLGEEIKALLELQGYTVLHSTDFHDLDYRQSYNNSRITAQALVNQVPLVSLLLDIHRDGFGTSSTQGRQATTAIVNGREAGKLLFVIGTAHPHWRQNYQLAAILHNLCEELYPGLSRGVMLSDRAKYNQDVHAKAVLVEIGGHWNTMEEALYGARLFTDVLLAYLEEPVGGQ